MTEPTQGQRLRAFRDSKGWTQLKMGLEMGVTANTVARWERDEVRMSGAAERLLWVLENQESPQK